MCSSGGTDALLVTSHHPQWRVPVVLSAVGHVPGAQARGVKPVASPDVATWQETGLDRRVPPRLVPSRSRARAEGVEYVVFLQVVRHTKRPAQYRDRAAGVKASSLTT